MKQFIITTAAVLFMLSVKAQNVGIGTTTPSENLHVDSVIKIGKNLALPVGTTRKNLIKFGDGSYVTIGEETGDDKMYLRYGDLLLLKSPGSAGNGNIGVNTETPSAQLDVNGTFRLRGNGATSGYVLTTDANGNASWQPSGNSANIGFRGRLLNDLTVTQAAGEVTITGFTAIFNDGGGFNAAAGTFTAPADGVYQFQLNANWSQNTTNTGSTIILTRLQLTRSGTTNIIEQNNSTLFNNTAYSGSVLLSSVYKLSAGDVISVAVDPQASYNMSISGGTGSGTCSFTGVKLY